VTSVRYPREAVAAAREIADLVEGYVPRLSSRDDLVPRHLAAMSVARANRLLCGIRDLTDHDLDDVGGVLLRALLEVWMVGLYVLYGGDEATEHVLGAHVRSLKNLDPGAFPSVPAVLEEWEEFELPTDRIKWEDLAPQVGRLLEAAGQSRHPANMKAFYEVLYRGYSHMDAHGGLQTLAPHMVSREDRMELSIKRPPQGDPNHELVTAAGLVGYLACQVLAAFGFSIAPIVKALSAVQQTAEDA
jgi:Family of unknown function (DUF5677)